MSDDKKLDLREYAWNWFSYHAAQRTSMFNYYLAAAALLAAGFGATIDKLPVVAAAIGILGALVTLSFIKIDGRNDELVRRGESVLKALEQSAFPHVAGTPKKDHPMPAGILNVDEHAARTSQHDGLWFEFRRGMHRIHLRLIEYLFLVAFVLGTAAAIWMPGALQQKDPSADNVRLLSLQVAHLNASLTTLSDRMANVPAVQPSAQSQPAPRAGSATAPRGN